MAEEKRQIRLVHNREGEGPLLIADVDQGLPREHLDEERGQEVYIPHDRLTFVMDGTAASVDRNPDIPGFIDLVPSDKVLLSREQGVIARLEEDGLLEVVELPEGGIQDVEITDAAQDHDGGGGDGSVTILGSGFESFSPDETTVVLEEGSNGDEGTEHEFSVEDIEAEGTFSDEAIHIPASNHDQASDAFVGGTATVRANRTEDTEDIVDGTLVI